MGRLRNNIDSQREEARQMLKVEIVHLINLMLWPSLSGTPMRYQSFQISTSQTTINNKKTILLLLHSEGSKE